jgi:hypothetical protein
MFKNWLCIKVIMSKNKNAYKQQEEKVLFCISNKYKNEIINYEPIMNIIEDYTSLPILPTNKEINISKIGIYCWDSIQKESQKIIHYSDFTRILPLEFPVIKYLSPEYISPVLLIDTDGKKYRIDKLLWFPLTEIRDSLIKNISLEGDITWEHFFPKKIFTDTKNKWINELLFSIDIFKNNSI